MHTFRQRDLEILEQYEKDVTMVVSLGRQGMLTEELLHAALALLEVPAMIRGYGHVKAASLEPAKLRRDAILHRLRTPSSHTTALQTPPHQQQQN